MTNKISDTRSGCPAVSRYKAQQEAVPKVAWLPKVNIEAGLLSIVPNLLKKTAVARSPRLLTTDPISVFTSTQIPGETKIPAKTQDFFNPAHR